MGAGGAPERSEVCDYVAQRTGSSLSTHQLHRLRSAIGPRLRGRSEASFLEHLKSAEGAAELAELMAAISVHKTDLFRDEVQLAAFKEQVLAALARSARRPLRLWSAGCATGEEVATLLILLAEADAHPGSTVLGTDLSAGALRTAGALTFEADVMRRVPEALRRRYFCEREGRFALDDGLRTRASFLRHNLMDVPYPLPPDRSGFDVIFCRNVLIYFTEEAFDSTVSGLAERLGPGGTLVLSAAEPILKVHPALCTLKCESAFFYARKTLALPVNEAPKRVTGEYPAALPNRVTGDFPAVVPRRTGDFPAVIPRRVTGELPAVGGLRRTLTGELQAASDPREEAQAIFELVLDWAAAGEGDEATEQGLRRSLYLDPHFAQARYLLGMLLEQRGARADAATEYRRALGALSEGRSRVTAFFLNDERLKTACAVALRRLGFRS